MGGEGNAVTVVLEREKCGRVGCSVGCYEQPHSQRPQTGLSFLYLLSNVRMRQELCSLLL